MWLRSTVLLRKHKTTESGTKESRNCAWQCVPQQKFGIWKGFEFPHKNRGSPKLFNRRGQKEPDIMASILRKTALSTVFFATGFAAFARAWPADSIEENTRKIEEQRVEIINSIKSSKNYQELLQNKNYTSNVHSSRIPQAHQVSHVSQGLLFGPQHLEIDPIVFSNPTDNELQAYYHLGQKLTSYDGTIHNGVISTILDELLCFCGFHLLPSGRGVTAKLAIDFLQHADPDTTVLLKAKVAEHKGRKVIINGHIETVEDKPKIIATANCILVEPKWFKYFSWLSIF